MLIYLKINPADTLSSATVKNYPAITSIVGSPFSGGSLSSLGSGWYSINIGAVAGEWAVDGFNVGGEILATGFASSSYVDPSGNANVFAFPPWQTTSLLETTVPAGYEGGTIEINQGDSYDGVSNPKFSWAVTKNYTAWTGVFRLRHRITNTLLIEVVATATSATNVDVALSVTHTEFFGLLLSASEFGPHPYDIEFTSGTSKETPLRGQAITHRLTAGLLPDSGHSHFGGTITIP